MKPSPRIEVSIQELQAILEHARPALSITEFDALQGAMQTLELLTRELEKKGVSIQRLRQMLFGAATETTAKVLEKILDRVGKEPADGAAEEKAAPGKKPKGHGRHGAEDYTGAKKVLVPLAGLHAGDPCPSCAKGTVYASCEPGLLVRLTGQAPLGGTVYELEKLRCGLCGEVFSAAAPQGVGEKKFDAESAAMVALLKYGTGLPFHRLEGLQANLGIPLPAATQWEIVQETAGFLTPALQAMIRLAAQGQVLHNDDTTMKALSLGAAKAYVQAWTPKDHELRSIPLSEQAVKLLSGWQTTAPVGCPYVFMEPDRWDYYRQQVDARLWKGEQDLVNNVLRRFKTLCKRAGVGPFTIHDLRRSCITNWAKQLPIHVVQQLAGHSDIKTTQEYYLSVQPEDLTKAQAVQQALVSGILERGATDQELTKSGRKRCFAKRRVFSGTAQPTKL